MNSAVIGVDEGASRGRRWRGGAAQILRSRQSWFFILVLAITTAVVNPLIDRFVEDSWLVFGLCMAAVVPLIGFEMFRPWKMRRPQG